MNLLLASNWKRIASRTSDMGITMIVLTMFQLIVSKIFFKTSKVSYEIESLILFIFFLMFFLNYFVFLPIYTQGQTLGKKIFGITLRKKNNEKIPAWFFFLREAYILIFPLIIVFSIIAIAEKFDLKFESSVLIAGNFFSFWFFFLFLIQKVNQKQQLFYDRRFDVYVVDVLAQKTKSEIKKDKIPSITFTKLNKNSIVLDSNQKQAVELSLHKNALIIAGPGTGKTTVLVNRIDYLVNNYRIKPWRILALTFTKKACNNIRERIIKKRKTDNEKFQIYTYHSFCYKFLREEIDRLDPATSEIIVLDELDQKIIIKNLITENPGPYRQKKIDSATIKKLFFFIEKKQRNLITDKKHFQNFFEKNFDFEVELTSDFINFIWQLSINYEKHKKEEGLVDFNDLLIKTYDLLKSNPNLLKQWQNRFDSIVIDEFQDTSHLQYRIIEILSDQGKKIKTMVIGDPDQTIYTWRNANIKFILDFSKKFLPSEEINLINNYRSTKAIISVANQLIDFNHEYSRKKIRVIKTDSQKVELFRLNGRFSEAREIVNQIEKLKRDDVDLKKIVVLYRSNFLSAALESFFLQKDINYKIYKGIQFFLRQEVKDMISLISLIINPKDFAVQRIINWIPGIGPVAIQKLRNKAFEQKTSLFDFLLIKRSGIIGEKHHQIINELFFQIKNFQNSINENEKIENFVTILFKKIYQPFLKAMYIDEQWRVSNVMLLIEVIKNYEKMNINLSLKNQLSNFLTETKISAVDNFIKNPNAVSLMTIHNAKGLEFDYVFIFDVSAAIFPPKKTENKNMIEERRIFFVALTRAHKKLYIFTNLFEPSIFINEIEKNSEIIEKRGYY